MISVPRTEVRFSLYENSEDIDFSFNSYYSGHCLEKRRTKISPWYYMKVGFLLALPVLSLTLLSLWFVLN
ncbi:hypothetical protein L3N51_01384 [Metallosphaera sp. J1]|uniref:hypothetical protein n=1 Tax=Metallosphaera javensis (ex Hofmann et al. 2022) TaxID=99938 RepID=UPI001EDE2E63|nr:hypothetical protein [Metallosphaera javensis (ex Hofmann et al. 2022)]MCG3109094.1 hypothetical protein [Metallosphaera javensis (ex Hofmann et al. 2022)]